MLRTESLIVIVALVWSTVVYTPAVDGLTCYKCPWTNKVCATRALASNTNTEVCGTGSDATTTAATTTTKSPGAGGNATTAAAAGAATTAKPPAKIADAPTTASPAKKYRCYQVSVKDDKGVTWVERGCTESNTTDKCVTIDTKMYPKTEVVSGSCKLCETDKCNNGASIYGVSVQCALLSAALVAKLFCQIK